MKSPANVEKRKSDNAERPAFSACQIVIFLSQIKKVVEFGKSSFKCIKKDKSSMQSWMNWQYQRLTSLSTKPIIRIIILMKKSTLRLSTFFVLISPAFLGCDNLTENVKNIHEDTIEEDKDLNHANQIYMADIENYRKETGKTIDSNDQMIIDYKAKIDAKKEKCKYDYRQSIFKLELQNSYLKMKLDEYEPEGKENWEIFKAEYTSQLVELNKYFTGFANRNLKK